MQPDANHSNGDGAKKATDLSKLSPSLSTANRLARRSFLRNLGLGAVLLSPGAGVLTGTAKVLGAPKPRRLPRGDVAILQLLAAAELIEADLWQQYNELGGVDAPSSGYTAGLEI